MRKGKELKKGKKLIVSDLDGTLLDHVDNLSKSYSSRLNALIRRGLDFTVCTGRDFENTRISLQSLQFENPIVLTNGAIMCNYPSGKILDLLTIEHEDAIAIVKTGIDLKIDAMVYASYNKEKNEPRFIKGEWWDPDNIQRIQPEQYLKYAHEEVISIQYCNDKEKLDSFYNKVMEPKNVQYQRSLNILYFEDAFLPGKYWLEFNPINAKKEFMLKKLIKIKGYDPKDVIAFGDQKNDLGMLKMVGTSCTVENASIEVKKIADFVIPSNIDGGVIQFLEENIDFLL
jgi:Cof subfamily protein (haloacid dehalogenase superfamily)